MSLFIISMNMYSKAQTYTFIYIQALAMKVNEGNKE